MSAPVRILLAWLVVFAAASCTPEGTPGRRRLLVVGWDGASLRLVEPLLGAGRLPHLDALRQRGTSAPLRSTAVPISSAAWAAATTGYGPGETGVFGFHAPRAGTYEVELVSSRSLRRAPLWRLLTGRGRGSVVFGVPLTYPPEPIRGTLVAGMLSPFGADYAWPPGTADLLRARGFVPDLETWREDWTYTPADLERQLTLKEEYLVERLAQDDWDLAFVVFKSLDVVSHGAYGSDFATTVTPVYERLDAILGRLVETVGPDTNVLVVSDHGFTTYPRGVNLQAWLLANGFAARNEGALAEPRPEGTFDRRFAAERAQRLAQLDLARTQVLVDVCEGNVGSLRLNLAGREPLGPVTGQAVEDLLTNLTARLGEEDWVASVTRATQALPGPHRDALPDLLIEARPPYQLFADLGEEVRGNYEPVVPDHELLGLFVGAGPDLLPLRRELPFDLVDLAPTALHLLGEPVHDEMQGRVLLEIFADPRPVRSLPRASDPALERPDGPRGEAFTPAELQELERRLGPLGYGD